MPEQNRAGSTPNLATSAHPHLTPLMRAALQQALRSNGELRRVHDDREGSPPWPAHPASLAALVRHGLMEESERRSNKGHRMQLWQITDAGREALDPPKKAQRDVFRPMGGNTTSRVMVGGVWQDISMPEPEKDDVRREDLHHRHAESAQQRWNDAQDARRRASRLANELRAA